MAQTTEQRAAWMSAPPHEARTLHAVTVGSPAELRRNVSASVVQRGVVAVVHAPTRSCGVAFGAEPAVAHFGVESPGVDDAPLTIVGLEQSAVDSAPVVRHPRPRSVRAVRIRGGRLCLEGRGRRARAPHVVRVGAGTAWPSATTARAGDGPPPLERVAHRSTADAAVGRSRCRLAQLELDLVQIAAADLWRHDPAYDPLAPVTWIADDEHDRLHALGGAAGGSATAARQLGQLRSQRRMQTIFEACDDVAAFARGEPKPIVTAECDLYPSADERPVAVSLSEHAPAVFVTRALVCNTPIPVVNSIPESSYSAGGAGT